MTFLLRCSIVLITLVTCANSAWAHHPMGGEIPTTAWQGLLSGLGHPIIGIDHFAYIVAIGLVCAFARLRSPVVPLALVAATIFGASLKWSGVSLPYVEVVVAISVVVAGLMIAFTPALLKTAAFAAFTAAVFHGFAYGEAITGSEPAPLGAYLVGFSIIQMTIAGLAFIAGRWAFRSEPASQRVIQGISASVISGVGLIAFSTTVLA